MKINFVQELKRLDGSPLLIGGPCPACGHIEDSKQTTLRTVATEALTAQFRGEENQTGEEKVKRFRLAMQIQVCNELDLKAEEVTLVKSLVAKMYGPLIVGQAWEMLDPEK